MFSLYRNRDRDRDRDRDRGGWYDRGDYEQTGRGGRGGGSRNMNSMNMRKNDTRSRMRARDIEPEWMNAPVNQDETFDLRGFDDSPEKEEKKPPSTTVVPSADQGFNIDDILHMDVIPGRADFYNR